MSSERLSENNLTRILAGKEPIFPQADSGLPQKKQIKFYAPPDVAKFLANLEYGKQGDFIVDALRAAMKGKDEAESTLPNDIESKMVECLLNDNHFMALVWWCSVQKDTEASRLGSVLHRFVLDSLDVLQKRDGGQRE